MGKLLPWRFLLLATLFTLFPYLSPAQSFIARLFKTGRYARYNCAGMPAYGKKKNKHAGGQAKYRSTKRPQSGPAGPVSPGRPVVARPPGKKPPVRPGPGPLVGKAPPSEPPVRPPAEMPKIDPPSPVREITQEQRRQTLLQQEPEEILPPIRFITAQDEFSVVNMDSFMRAMELAQQGKVILIEGHTDNVGSDESNIQLSMKRAEKIRQLMLSGGVNDDLISVIGYGESRPLVPNTSVENQAVNRRIEFKVFSIPE
ncbi:MAG: OmpA family protein [Ferruginibacter sp.]|nr:OmpA family protein [Cytophagales bacterium]